MSYKRLQRWLGLALWLCVQAGCGQIDLDVDRSCESNSDCTLANGCHEYACNTSGICEKGPLKDNACWVDGACAFGGQEKGGDRCLVCRPEVSWSEFTPVACDEGLSCEPTTGGCVDDTASGTDADAGTSGADVIVDPPGDSIGPLEDTTLSPDAAEDVTAPDGEVTGDAVGPDDVAVAPDTVTEPAEEVLYGGMGLKLTIGESEVTVESGGSDEPQVFAIQNDGVWGESDHLILRSEREEQVQFFVLKSVGLPQGWEMPPVKPGLEPPGVVLFFCHYGYSPTPEGAMSLVGAADATEPYKTGCPTEKGLQAWILVASEPDVLAYWGPESCCGNLNQNGSAPGCDDTTCSDQVCVESPYCCETAWDEGCVEEAQACAVCDICGDGYCDEQFGEECVNCSQDCGVCLCSEDEGYTFGCDGSCVLSGEPSDTQGDGQCDPEWDCAEFEYDSGDCCADGLIGGCSDECVAPSIVGNGTCDAELNCPKGGWDGGDCVFVCPAGKVPGCEDGTCVFEALKGNGQCDSNIDCALHAYDGGDCCLPSMQFACDGTCTDSEPVSDGVCDPLFACSESAWDAGDCPVECGANELAGCAENTCVQFYEYGDDNCDDALNCEALNFDGGDCCPDDDEEICNKCFSNDADMSSKLGDGTCDEDLSCAANSYDNGDCQPSCGANEIGCTGAECVFHGWLGDGICDEALACGEYALDGGDCCPEGLEKMCDGSCLTLAEQLALESNEVCDAQLDCADKGFDGEACEPVCDVGMLAGCEGSCVWPQWGGDGTCDAALDCEGYAYDYGDCCEPGLQKTCGGVCASPSLVGDGTCDVVNQCASLGWDGGDCPVVCPEGTLIGCGGVACYSTDWLADDACDVSLNCAETNWDGGDCSMSCPDGAILTCAQDACKPLSWLGDKECHPALLCEAHNWDDADCCAGHAYNQICEPESDEDALRCPEDCQECANNTDLAVLILDEVDFDGAVGGQESYPLTDVVATPTGSHYVTWSTADTLFVTEFSVLDPPNEGGSLQGETASQGLLSKTVGAPSLALRSDDGRLAIAYRSESSTGVFLMRSLPDNPIGLWAELQLLAGDYQFAGRVEVAHAPQPGAVFISTLFSEAGAENLDKMSVGLIRSGANGGMVSEGIEPLVEGSNGVAGAKSSPALVSLSDGRAVVAWRSGSGALVIRWMNFEGEKGPVTVVSPGELGEFDVPALIGSPVMAVRHDDKNRVTIATRTAEFNGVWLVTFDVTGNEVVDQTVKSIGPTLANFQFDGFYPRSHDLAVNADGWSILAVATLAGPQVIRVPPNLSDNSPDALSLDSDPALGFLPRVAAASCFDDIVVMLTPQLPEEPLRRVRLLADDDADGVPDFCCVAQ